MPGHKDFLSARPGRSYPILDFAQRTDFAQGSNFSQGAEFAQNTPAPESLAGEWADSHSIEEMLRDSQRSFATLANHVPQLVWMCTPDGMNIYFNQRWVDYTGLSLDESYGTGWSKPFHPEERQIALDAWQEAVRTHGKYSVESRLRAADGSYRWFLVRGEPLGGLNGNVLRWCGTCTDIEEFKQAETMLRTGRKHMESVVNSLPCCVALISGESGESGGDLRLQLVNPSYQALAPGRPMAGKTVDEVWPELYPGFGDVCREVLAMGKPCFADDQPLDLSRFEGGPAQRTYFSWSIHRMDLGENHEVGLLTTGWETTERKRAEEALLRSEKLASAARMASSIAHEVNNPLAAVMNTLYLARMNADDTDAVRRYLDMADGELKRIVHLTRQTLGFYRESSLPIDTSVAITLDGALDLLSAKIKAKEATVIREYRGDPHTMAIPGELLQVFSSLLLNSLEAIGDGGQIRLRLSEITCPPDGRAVLRVSVADTGRGIEAATLPRIFEPLFTTKTDTGSGLGLWVARQIVEKHGGAIRLRTQTAAGRSGTTFSVLLPVQPVTPDGQPSSGPKYEPDALPNKAPGRQGNSVPGWQPNRESEQPSPRLLLLR